MSKEQIRRCVEEIDQQRCALLDQLEALDETTLKHKPKAHDWSALGIAQHLMLSERLMLDNLPDPTQLKPKKQSLKAHLMYPIATLILNNNISVAAPSAVVPDESLSLVDIRRQWDESQAWLKSFVEQWDVQTLVQPLIVHPIIGPLPTLKLLKFIQTHFNYHHRQIQQRVA